MNIKEGKVVKGGRNTPPTTERPSKPEGQQPQYTECEKMQKVQKESQIIGEFLEWLGSEKEYSICKFCEYENREGSYYPVQLDKEQLLAEFFEVDLNKVEEERRAILEGLRK